MMRQMPLVGLLLLTTAASAEPRHPITHACAGPATHGHCARLRTAHHHAHHRHRRIRFNTQSAVNEARIVPPASAAVLTVPASVIVPAPPAPNPAPIPVPIAPARIAAGANGRTSQLLAVLMLWALILIAAALLVRLVVTRGTTAPREALQTGPADDSASPGDYKTRCVVRLRDAGWDARTRFSAGLPGPDVIARSNGMVLALRCHASARPVDIEAVEDACMVRECQHSDLAAIVSNAPFTEAARQLAARTGIVLLHEDELASFAA